LSRLFRMDVPHDMVGSEYVTLLIISLIYSAIRNISWIRNYRKCLLHFITTYTQSSVVCG